MHNEDTPIPRFDFNLNEYQRDENGQVADIEDARAIIRNLLQIIQFLEASAFAHLPLASQSEIALYLVGTYLLTHNSDKQDPQYHEKLALLDTLVDEKFTAILRQDQESLNTADILGSVEEMFKNFGL